MHLHPLLPAVALVTVALSATNCAPPPPVETPREAAAEPRPADARREPPASFEPVPEPQGMLAALRLASPQADLTALREFVTPKDEFGKLILSDPQKVIDLFFGSLGPHVDLTAPVDAV